MTVRIGHGDGGVLSHSVERERADCFELKAENRNGAVFKLKGKTADLNWIAEWHRGSVLYEVTGGADFLPVKSI